MTTHWLERARSLGLDWPEADMRQSAEDLVRLSAKWDVQLVDVIGEPTCSLAVAGRLTDGTPVVLKVPIYGEEKTTGYRAAMAFDGHGGVPILNGEDESGSLLMIHLEGPDLSDLPPDDATEIWIDLACQIAGAPPIDGFPLAEYLVLPEAPVYGFSSDEHESVVRLREHLLATTQTWRLVHGDLHHFNILQHQGHWYAIDPKGTIADPCYEASSLLRNPFKALLIQPEIERYLSNRIDRIAERTGLDAGRIRDWAICQTYSCAEDYGSEPNDWAKAMIRVTRALMNSQV